MHLNKDDVKKLMADALGYEKLLEEWKQAGKPGSPPLTPILQQWANFCRESDRQLERCKPS
jgi:hypothetical protein